MPNAERAQIHIIYCVVILLPLLLFMTACVTSTSTPPERIIGRPGAEVFKLPLEAGFQDEVLELKDGRLRYWFSSDVVIKNPPKYPIEGAYRYEGDQLILSDGRILAAREMNGVRTLWKTSAVDYWKQGQIIDPYGIFLPAQGIESRPVTLKPFFTSEQWAESIEAVRRLERAKK